MLLVSDWHQRRSIGGKIPRVAIVQHSASAALDEGVLGVLDSLKANGLIDGQNIRINRFNADAAIVSRDKLTTLMVTHSMQQAASLGGRLVMMHRGRVIHDLCGA